MLGLDYTPQLASGLKHISVDLVNWHKEWTISWIISLWGMKQPVGCEMVSIRLIGVSLSHFALATFINYHQLTSLLCFAMIFSRLVW